ncbi:hypothetical protein EVJ58_g10507 [Rhodofomes roseus]|uniref:Uncharacterized protein n=1 Tax=Rhodofomes roseus TaxID=34475 RepID=A0A4Y9XQA9_9APHY|nr:hypothetical protein EVJ58_g10507 [Rhodofomes roseus]
MNLMAAILEYLDKGTLDVPSPYWDICYEHESFSEGVALPPLFAFSKPVRSPWPAPILASGLSRDAAEDTSSQQSTPSMTSSPLAPTIDAIEEYESYDPSGATLELHETGSETGADALASVLDDPARAPSPQADSELSSIDSSDSEEEIPLAVYYARAAHPKTSTNLKKTPLNNSGRG